MSLLGSIGLCTGIIQPLLSGGATARTDAALAFRNRRLRGLPCRAGRARRARAHA